MQCCGEPQQLQQSNHHHGFQRVVEQKLTHVQPLALHSRCRQPASRCIHVAVQGLALGCMVQKRDTVQPSDETQSWALCSAGHSTLSSAIV